MGGLIKIFTFQFLRKKPFSKKQLIIGGAVLLIVALTLILLRIDYLKKKEAAAAQAEQARAEEEKEKLLLPSDKPLSPQEILEREEKLAGIEVKKLLTEKKEKEIKDEIEQASLRKPGELTKQDVFITADEGLPDLLRELLKEGKPGLVYSCLREMLARGLDPVKVLRQVIVDNPDKAKIRKNALVALFYIGGEESVPLFKTAATVDPEEEVRLLALFLLDFITGNEEKYFFEDVSKEDISEAVRAKAEEYRKFRSKCR